MVAEQNFESTQLLRLLDALDEWPSPLRAHMDSQSTWNESPIRLVAVAGLKFDRRCSRRMSWSQVKLKRHVADSHRLALFEQKVSFDGNRPLARVLDHAPVDIRHA